MAAHTPGPWYCGQLRTQGRSPGCDIGAENNSNVAIVHHEPLDREERETKANARLIAAAPDLLAALQILVTQYNEGPDCVLGGKLTNAGFLSGRAAIAKATS